MLKSSKPDSSDVDTSVLLVIAEEIERNFDAATAALDRRKAHREDSEALTDARLALAQVRGALEVAGVAGIPRVVRELEALIGDLGADDAPPEHKALALGRQALASIRRHLSELTAGISKNPLELSPVLQDLLTARQSFESATLELFRPDLSPLPPESHEPHDSGALNRESMLAARSRFQKGLLSWLRFGDQSGLLIMRGAVESIESACSTRSMRAPWWVAAGFLDQLIEGKLEPTVPVKRVCSGLDQHMRRAFDGATEAPATLMREMLYFLAVSEPASERSKAIRKTYHIEAIKPVRAPAEGRSVPFMRQFAPLHDLENVLERAIAGDPSSLDAFIAGIEQASLEAPPDAKVAALLQEVLHAAAALREQSPEAHASLAVETATTLLFLQDILSRWTEADEDLHSRIEAATRRLRAARTGIETDEAAWTGLFGAARRKAQDTALTGRLLTELLATLSDAEQRLAKYFEDKSELEALAAAEVALVQARGALQIAADKSAVGAAAFCLGQIIRFQAHEDAGGQEDFSQVAAVLSGLRYYIEELKHGEADFAAIMMKAGAPEMLYASAVEVEPPEDYAPEATVTDLPAENAHAGSRARDSGLDLPADADLLEVFADEASEVLADMQDAIARLHHEGDDAQPLEILRRGFHTLKGGARMLGLTHISEEAEKLERVLEDIIDGGAPSDSDLLRLIESAQARCTDWLSQLRTDGKLQRDTLTLDEWSAPSDYTETTTVQFDAAEAQDAPIDEAGELEIGFDDVRMTRTLFDVFLTEAGHILPALTSGIGGLKATPGTAPSHELFRLAHTLSGIAGTVGFAAVHDLAGSLERVIWTMHESELPTRPDDEILLEETAAALQVMVDSISAHRMPEPRADLEEQLRALAIELARDTQRDLVAESLALTPGPDSPVDLEFKSLSPFEQPDQTVAFELSVPDLDRSVEPVELDRTDRRRERLVDEIDAELLPVFLEEAHDLLPRVVQELREWRAAPQGQTNSQALTRLLHTFKGSARMAGAMALGELTHAIETRIAVTAQLASIPDSVFDALEASIDRVGALLQQLALPASDATADLYEIGVSDQAAPTNPVTFADPESADDAPEPTGHAATADDVIPQKKPKAHAAKPGRTQTTQLRVKSELVERLVAEAGEVALARSRMEGEVRAIRGSLREMADNIARLRSQARELEIQAESQLQSRMTLQTEPPQGQMDPLEFDRFTRLQELTRFVGESANDVATLQQGILQRVNGCDAALAAQARMTRLLQDALMSVRLVPFSSLSERLYRVVRMTAREAGKRVSLDIQGGRVELDRGVLDRMAGPLEHLLRNAVVHGIETAERRRSAGKPDAGEIVLSLFQEGNEVQLTLRDDGAGFDLQRLRAKAIGAGLMTPDQKLSDLEIAQFAFVAGVSTADDLTESAGRGVGLDVVRSEVTALGGRVELAFERGSGASFTVHLPLMVSVMHALLVRSGGQTFCIPTAIVEQTRLADHETIKQMHALGHIEWQGFRYPLHVLSNLLELRADTERQRRHVSVVLVKAGPERVAIQVEKLIGHQEVVVKNIGSQVARVSGISGAAVLGSGEIVLILNPVRLSPRAAAVRNRPTPRSEFAVAAEPVPAVTIMVVDDSLTIRRITSRVLAREGFRVVEARDGLDALDKLQQSVPDLILLDIEMPRMDGFELLRQVRADSRWQDIPVVMITSRTADRHRKYAAELGVSVFLGKPFEERELLSHVAALTAVIS